MIDWRLGSKWEKGGSEEEANVRCWWGNDVYDEREISIPTSTSTSTTTTISISSSSSTTPTTPATPTTSASTCHPTYNLYFHLSFFTSTSSSTSILSTSIYPSTSILYSYPYLIVESFRFAEHEHSPSRCHRIFD